MKMLQGGNNTDSAKSDDSARLPDQYLISSFKPERLSWNSHEPTSRPELSSRDSGATTRQERGPSGPKQSTERASSRQNPTNFVNNQLFHDVSEGKYSSLEEKEHRERHSEDADIAHHRQYDIRYSESPLPEISPRSKKPKFGQRSHHGQFYEGENRHDRTPSADYQHRNQNADTFLDQRQSSVSRYQNSARGHYSRDEVGGIHGGYQHHHPGVSRQSYPGPVDRRWQGGGHYDSLDTGQVDRRWEGGVYYDSVDNLYEDSQPAFNEHVVSTHPLAADRQLAPVG